MSVRFTTRRRRPWRSSPAAHSGALSHTELLAAFYQNILHRAPDVGGRACWVDTLDGGVNVALALEGFSDSAEHQALRSGSLHGVSYIPYVAWAKADIPAARLAADLPVRYAGCRLVLMVSQRKDESWRAILAVVVKLPAV